MHTILHSLLVIAEDNHCLEIKCVTLFEMVNTFLSHILLVPLVPLIVVLGHLLLVQCAQKIVKIHKWLCFQLKKM